MIPVKLITDRTAADVQRVSALNAKPLDSWTEAEREEYIGDCGVLLTIDGDLLECLDGVIYTADGPLKGAYNAADLNRVETAVDYVGSVLNGLMGYLEDYGEEFGVSIDRDWIEDPAVGDLTVKTDWQANVKPDRADLDRYLDNIKKFRVFGLSGAGLPDSMERLTYQQANAVEQLLVDAYDTAMERKEFVERMVLIVTQSFIYSGEIYGGEFL